MEHYLISADTYEWECEKRSENAVEYGDFLDLATHVWICPNCKRMYVWSRENNESVCYVREEDT